MIPKIIHYIWLGGGAPLPEQAVKCIASWKKYCPDYIIKRWDESNFDVNSNLFCKQAYEQKKYAFASDYIRLFALVNYGGIYMDIDVEVVKPLDEFLNNVAFSGFEKASSIPTGIMACEKGYFMFDTLLKEYDTRVFVNQDGSLNLVPNTTHFTDLFLLNGLVLNNCEQVVSNFHLFPCEVFCPKDYKTGIINLTSRTATIHHFDGSWLSKKYKKVLLLLNKYRIKYNNWYKLLFTLHHPFYALYYQKTKKIMKRGS